MDPEARVRALYGVMQSLEVSWGLCPLTMPKSGFRLFPSPQHVALALKSRRLDPFS